MKQYSTRAHIVIVVVAMETGKRMTGCPCLGLIMNEVSQYQSIQRYFFFITFLLFVLMVMLYLFDMVLTYYKGIHIDDLLKPTSFSQASM